MMNGLMTLHDTCQKKLGLCPVMNFMSSLNLGRQRHKQCVYTAFITEYKFKSCNKCVKSQCHLSMPYMYTTETISQKATISRGMDPP